MGSVATNSCTQRTSFVTFLICPAEFSRRWCTLNDGVFSYYESDRNSTPNGALKASEITCLAVDTPKKHGYTPNTPPHIGFIHVLLLQLHLLPPPSYNHTFEVYAERLYLFGTDDPDSHKEWVNSIAKVSSAVDRYVFVHPRRANSSSIRYNSSACPLFPRRASFQRLQSPC